MSARSQLCPPLRPVSSLLVNLLNVLPKMSNVTMRALTVDCYNHNMSIKASRPHTAALPTPTNMVYTLSSALLSLFTSPHALPHTLSSTICVVIQATITFLATPSSLASSWPIKLLIAELRFFFVLLKVLVVCNCCNSPSFNYYVYLFGFRCVTLYFNML